MLLLIVGIVAVAVGIGYVTARHFSEPTEALRDHAKSPAHERLDGGEDIDADDDEFDEFVKVFDDMQENLQRRVSGLRTIGTELGDDNLNQDPRTNLPGKSGAIMSDLGIEIWKPQNGFVEVQSIAGKFAAVSDETVSNAEETESMNQEIVRPIEGITHGTEQQIERLQMVADETNGLSTTVEEIIVSTDGVIQSVNEVVSSVDEERDHATEATAEISIIEIEAGEAIERVEALNEQMGEINEIAQLISDIAEQTGLPALNASIKAARTDEASESFTIVASEIKVFAREASKATDGAKFRVDKVRGSAGDTVDDIQSIQNSVESGSGIIGEVIEMSDHISGAVREAEHGVEEISRATENQAVSTEEIVSMVDGMSSVSEETTLETTTVSMVTEEQTAAINEVMQNIQQVSELAQSLKDLVDRFDVGDADDAGGGDRGDDAVSGRTSPAAPSRSMSRTVTDRSGTSPDSSLDD